MANLELTCRDSQLHMISAGKTEKKTRKEVDDIRRDEWSGEAVDSLLDVYEAKWNHRNRGNLKGGDWEDVAFRVTGRCGGSRVSKTPFQCKNKVASMKQKYRSEALLQGINGSTASRWPYFTRMDLMLRVPTKEDEGTLGDGITAAGGMQVAETDLRLQAAIPQVESGDSEQEVTRREQGLFHGRFPNEKVESPGEGAAHHLDSNQEDASNTLPRRKVSCGQESDTSTPRSKTTRKLGVSSKPKNKHREKVSKEVVASIRSFANSILKLEEAKMEMFKDSERLRAELEARRVDMELRRTQIIMGTQLQIAKLLSGKCRKRKAFKPANGTASAVPPGRPSTLQSAPQVHPADAVPTSLLPNLTPLMHSIPTPSMAHAPASAKALQFGILPKQC